LFIARCPAWSGSARGSAHCDAALRWALAEAEAHGDGRVTAVFSWQLPAEGDPAEALVAAATGADHLVVGTRGRSL
jgi:nucleotide-binding universal stress UspA family protein